MRWGFKLPDRLLFNARSEGIENAKFWKEYEASSYSHVLNGRRSHYNGILAFGQIFGDNIHGILVPISELGGTALEQNDRHRYCHE